MEISYDPVKNERNIRERALSFDQAKSFDFSTAIIAIDNRKEYGEVRYVAYGLIGNRVHALAFTPTAKGIRVISLRKANLREVRKYENPT
jgi:uncharacterized DUF497 family protein